MGIYSNSSILRKGFIKFGAFEYFLFAVSSFFIAASVIYDQVIYLFLFTVAILFFVFFIRDARFRFIATFAIIVVLNMNPAKILLGYIGAIIFITGFTTVLVKRKLFSHRPLTSSPLFIPLSIFLLLGTSLGLWGVSRGVIDIELWFREFLLWAPIFLLPIYYSEIVEKVPRPENYLKWGLLLLWAIVFVVEVVKIKENLAQSVFVFQIGIRRIDSISGACLIFFFVSLSMVIQDSKKRLLLFGGFFISLVSLLLSFARTSWVAALPFIPLILLFGNKIERIKGLKFLRIIFALCLLFTIIGYFNIPSIKLAVGFIFSKFITVTHMKTDLSMYGRYIEWDLIMKYIHDSPILGYGFGANFQNYNWFGGYVFQTGFTHSAYLSILFKSGIVGLILLFTSYIGYILKGLKFSKSKYLTQMEKAYMRASVATILFITVLGYTGNIFLQREMSIYIALYWCYCIHIEHMINKRYELSSYL